MPFATATEVGGNTNPDFPTLHKQFTHCRNNIKSVQYYIPKHIHQITPTFPIIQTMPTNKNAHKLYTIKNTVKISIIKPLPF